MSGWADLPLTQNGLRQAQALGARLVGEPAPVIIYSSPLERALRTARIANQGLELEVVLAPALREIDCGEVDGLPLRSVQACHPVEWARNLAQSDPDFRWPGGESYREFRARILEGVRAIAERHRGQRVMIVTHAGVISQIIGWTRGQSPACWERFRPRNTSITELSWANGSAELLRFDDCGGSDCGESGSAGSEREDSFAADPSAKASIRPAQDP